MLALTSTAISKRLPATGLVPCYLVSTSLSSTAISKTAWQSTVVVWLVFTGINFGLLGESAGAQERTPLIAPATTPDAALPAELVIGAERLSEVFRATAKQLKPSVMTITSSVEVKLRDRNRAGEIGDLDLPPGFENFLPPEILEQLQPRSGKSQAGETESQEVPPEKMQSGMGSGIIVTEAGVILTNNHVIADADELQVELSDGRLFNASVIGSDNASDVAVLKIDAIPASHCRPRFIENGFPVVRMDHLIPDIRVGLPIF